MAGILQRAKDAISGHQHPTGPTGASTQLPQTIQSYYNAINNKDLNALRALFSENAIGYGFKMLSYEPLQGAAAIVEADAKMFAAFPDLKVAPTFSATDATGQWVFLRYTITGTNTGPCHGQAPTNKSVTVNGQSQIHLDQRGLISEYYLGASHLQMLNQLGMVVLPPSVTTSQGTTTSAYAGVQPAPAVPIAPPAGTAATGMQQRM